MTDMEIPEPGHANEVMTRLEPVRRRLDAMSAYLERHDARRAEIEILNRRVLLMLKETRSLHSELLEMIASGDTEVPGPGMMRISMHERESLDFQKILAQVRLREMQVHYSGMARRPPGCKSVLFGVYAALALGSAVLLLMIFHAKNSIF